MQRIDYGGVKVMLAMDNAIVRQGLQNVLQAVGFPRAVEVAALDRMIATLIEARFDVIITATELGGEALPSYLAQLRRGGLVHHPLPIIVTFLASADQDTVRRVIDCGPDDLLQMPVVPKQLLARLAMMAEKPRNFVVTSDYVGPDRRQTLRPGTLPIPVLEVPNPLALRIAHAADDQVKAAIATASDRLRAMRLARYVFELQWLLRAIRALFEQEAKDRDRLNSFCERIKTLLHGLPRLVAEGLPDELTQPCERLETGCNILIKNGFAADMTILQGLTRLIFTIVTRLRQTLPDDLSDSASPATAANS